ncbi:MAG: hypothetical protein K6G83_11570 [Lachnospiraceae bacterium]|nr:hypothetical protein [Lachnospiraceae bacterium]
MRKTSILKLCAVLTAFTVLSPAVVRADSAEETRIIQEMEGSQLTIERNICATKYAACVEETRIAKQYLGSVETLAKVNPLFAGQIEPAKARVAKAEEAEEKAKKALDAAMKATEVAQESVTIPVNKVQKLAVIDKDGIEQATFSVQSTGIPKDPAASLIISDLPASYLNYAEYGVIARYYTTEKLTETTEKSETAGKSTGTVTVTGEIPDGGYADQVAVEIFVEPNHSLVFLWNDDGNLRVTDRE